MPELPEVETMVRGIRDHFEGHTIQEFVECECKCRPMTRSPSLPEIQQRTRGVRVIEVTRRAKRIVLALESGDAFVIEPRMTGLMLVADPPNTTHLRFEWRMTRRRKRHSVWFWDRRGLGTLKLWSPEEFTANLADDRLGPDALALTSAEWQQRLARTSRPIKVALLDQKLVAGIGNLYASEILHRAGIHPEIPASRLSARRIGRLHETVLEVLHDAIAHEGSTLGDGTYRNALNKQGSYQNRHRVYARAGESCPSCGQGVIRRVVQAQRSTFYCPRCQRR